MKKHAPATLRNSSPIADVLAVELAPKATVLEIASGSGEHAVFMTRRFAQMYWQPSDPDAEAVASIAAWRAEAANDAILSPMQIDTRDDDWRVGTFDAIFCANMLHIAPWAAAVGLFKQARAHMAPDAKLILYGPFFEPDIPTAQSNIAFDKSLKDHNTEWGLRQLSACDIVAHEHGLARTARYELPANNLIVVYS